MTVRMSSYNFPMELKKSSSRTSGLLRRSIRKMEKPVKKRSKKLIRRLRKMRKAVFRNLIGGYIRAGSLPLEATHWENPAEFPASQPQFSGKELQTQELVKN